jgi:hypothetical protein
MLAPKSMLAVLVLDATSVKSAALSSLNEAVKELPLLMMRSVTQGDVDPAAE